MFTDRIENSQSQVSCDYMKGHVSPGRTNSIHCHDEYEFLLIVSGEITYVDNRGSVKMTDKSLVFTKAHEVHNPSTSRARLYERYRIAFKKESLSDFPFSEKIEKMISNSYKKILSDEDFSELFVYFKGIYELMKSGENDSFREKLYLLSALSKGSDCISKESESEENYVKDVIEYIKENYSEHLTCENIAERFFVSRGKLIYDFRDYADMTLLEYITLTRLEAAKELLLSGYSVTAAAERCGFSSPSYFIKVFFGIVGMTPLKFQTNFLRKR